MAGTYPNDFTPDLRRLKTWPSLKASLWRQPCLVELTHAEAYELVRQSVRGHRLRVLDVGCGTGFMDLELARIGHHVLGIDSNQEMIRLAARTARTDPYKKERGSLRYQVADFANWSDTSENYDVVLFSRVLHDMPQPDKVLSKVYGLLKMDGRIVCVEYAYDRLDRKGATWLYEVRKFLELAGWYSPPRLPDDPESGVDHITKMNLSGRRGHINKFEAMRRPLERLFHKEHLSWHAYHYWDLLGEMRVSDSAKEMALARQLRKMEQFLTDSGEIQPVLFHFVGTKSRA